MTEYQTEQAIEAVRAAKKAIAQRNYTDAHRYARLAIQYDPNLEDSGWLWLQPHHPVLQWSICKKLWK